MNARDLTASLGGHWHGRYGTACCRAHADRRPSLTIRDGERAILLSCKAGCTQDAIIAALRAMGLWSSSPRKDNVSWRPPAPKPPEKPKDTSYVERLWQQTRPAPGTLVDLYLRARCITWAIPPAIRFHHLLPYHDSGHVVGAWPAMVTRLDDSNGNLIGVQRTWLNPAIDGNPVGKALLPGGLPSRKTLGAQGSRDVDSIIVGEGIESALAASEYGDEGSSSWWGLTPVAAISATGLARFVIPPNIRRLFIVEDADDAGRKATKTLVGSARAAGVRVMILRVEPLDGRAA